MDKRPSPINPVSLPVVGGWQASFASVRGLRGDEMFAQGSKSGELGMSHFAATTDKCACSNVTEMQNSSRAGGEKGIIVTTCARRKIQETTDPDGDRLLPVALH